jgi:hypothetical protein
MSTGSDFKPKSLTASEYILDLFDPAENVAVVVRRRATGKAIQRIARAETVAGPEFQTWLANQNAAGSDLYVTWNRTGWFVLPTPAGPTPRQLQSGLVQIEPTKERGE